MPVCTINSVQTTPEMELWHRKDAEFMLRLEQLRIVGPNVSHFGGFFRSLLSPVFLLRALAHKANCPEQEETHD